MHCNSHAFLTPSMPHMSQDGHMVSSKVIDKQEPLGMHNHEPLRARVGGVFFEGTPFLVVLKGSQQENHFFLFLWGGGGGWANFGFQNPTRGGSTPELGVRLLKPCG